METQEKQRFVVGVDYKPSVCVLKGAIAMPRSWAQRILFCFYGRICVHFSGNKYIYIFVPLSPPSISGTFKPFHTESVPIK